MAKHKSYTVTESPMGFSVEGGSDRVKIIVSLRGVHWLLEDELGMHQEKFGFFEVTKLAKEAANIMLEYEVDKVMDPDIKHIDKHRSTFLLSKFLCKIVSTQLKRLKTKIDPIILDVQRAIFTSSMGCGKVAMDPKFYTTTTASKYLLSDISKYRPARNGETFINVFLMSKESHYHLGAVWSYWKTGNCFIPLTARLTLL